jgi:hypothetical protein
MKINDRVKGEDFPKYESEHMSLYKEIDINGSRASIRSSLQNSINKNSFSMPISGNVTLGDQDKIGDAIFKAGE